MSYADEVLSNACSVASYTRSVLATACAAASRPDARLTVSEWADAHRMLSTVASSEAGPWRTDRTPYLREIMDALSASSPVTRVVFAKGAQIGGTEAGNCWIGYVIAHAPGPMLCLMPTDATAEDNVRTRIDPLIESTPSIREKVAVRGAKEGGNTLTRKDFPGGMLAIRGANAPSKLRSLPIRFLFLDEVDAYELDLGGEGDPVALAKARARTFGSKRKEYEVSTPTIAGRSRIWAAYEETDQRRFFVPCPHCGEFQTIDWARIKWTEESAPPWLECERNGCVIEERHKPRMLAGGEWRATAECDDADVRGYHLSALYSPYGWYSWAQARKDFLIAKRDKNPARMKTWVNTVLGECWEEKGEAPSWELLYARRESYDRNVAPRDGLVLTAGVDVQRDRVEVEVKAWGPRLENWTVDHRVFVGDPSRLDGERSPWPSLAAMLSESWPHELGGRIGITTMAVDSSDQTQSVYSFCRQWSATKVMAVKGRDEASTLISTPKRVDVRSDGVVIKHGVALWIVGVSVAKSEFYGWLRQSRPASDETVPTGWSHWPELPEEWFKQLTAEQITTKVVRGFKKTQWEKVRERNEALDLHVYNRCAAAQIGIDRWESKRWESIRRELTIAVAEGSEASPTTAHQKLAKPRKSSYWK